MGLYNLRFLLMTRWFLLGVRMNSGYLLYLVHSFIFPLVIGNSSSNTVTMG